MDTPLVSIIVSCFNGEKYIQQTLESLLNQTYENLEIIIVNDGSTDASETIIKKFTDSRITYFYQVNMGQCAALNSGFKKSRGTYIKFYDCDDILNINVIEGQVAALAMAGEHDVSFIEWRRFKDENLPTSISENKSHTIGRDCTPVEFITFTGTPPMYQCGMWLIPRKVILSAGLWNEGLSLINDTEYFPRLLTKVSSLKFSRIGYTLYRTNTGSATLSGDFSVKGMRSALKATDLAAKWYLSIENSERMRKIIIQSYELILDWSYPTHPKYAQIIAKRLRNLGVHKITLQKGKKYDILSRYFGWKFAKRISYWRYRTQHNKF